MKTNSFQESLQTILAHCRPCGTERVSFHQALGRVLAEDLAASVDDPPAPKSAMDGFALRAADTRAAGAENSLEFPYGETVGAGHVAQGAVTRGLATRIMTGALLPDGADAVVKLEDTTQAGEGRIALQAPLEAGENVIPAGARIKKGDTLLRTGDVVTPSGLGVLAGLGASRPLAFRRPRLAILALGDELVEPGRPLPPGKIYVSNLYALGARAARLGAEIRPLGIAGDRPGLILNLLRPRVVADPPTGDPLGCEIIVTVGGSHGGDFDFAGQVFQKLGATLHFRRTRLNLGGSMLFATLGGTLFFGLPGTPVPSWGAFELMVRPALWLLAGRTRLATPLVKARLDGDYRAQPGRTCFAPAWLRFDAAGEAVVTPLRDRGGRGSPPAAMANGLMQVPEGADRLEANAPVMVEWLEG